MRTFTLVAITMALSGHSVAGEVSLAPIELQLKSGEIVRGSLASEEAQSLTVRCIHRTKSGIASANLTYAREDISSVTDLEHSYQQSLAQTSPQADQQFALAQWCIDHGLDDHAAHHALVAMAAEPTHERAVIMLQKLGYLRAGGKWVEGSVYLAEHGLAIWKDKIVTTADWKRLSLDQAKVEAAIRDLLAKQSSLVHIESLIGIDEKSLAANKLHQTKLDADITAQTDELTQGQKRITEVTKKLADATRVVKSQSTEQGRRARFPSQASLDAEKQAQADIDDAQAQQAHLQEKQKTDQREKSVLVAHEKTLNQEIDLCRSQLGMAMSGLDMAKTSVKAALDDLSALEASVMTVSIM